MPRPVNKPLSHSVIRPSPADATEVELVVMSWFAAGHEVLWIPIYEVADGPDGIVDARDEAAHFGGVRPICDFTDFYRLPTGIKGWLFPAHLDDTQIVALRAASQELHIGYLLHPSIGRRISWRFNTEADVSQAESRPGHIGAIRGPV